jgi:hypothetical protein
MSRLRIIGTILVIVGGVLFLVALTFLPYFSSGLLGRFFREPTLWDVTTREPVILTMVGVAAILSAVGALLTDEPVLLILASVFSFYLFGRIFPVGPVTYRLYGVGFWVATAATFTMSVGCVLAVAGLRFARRS